MPAWHVPSSYTAAARSAYLRFMAAATEKRERPGRVLRAAIHRDCMVLRGLSDPIGPEAVFERFLSSIGDEIIDVTYPPLELVAAYERVAGCLEDFRLGPSYRDACATLRRVPLPADGYWRARATGVADLMEAVFGYEAGGEYRFLAWAAADLAAETLVDHHRDGWTVS